jgi:O-antigen ligase
LGVSVLAVRFFRKELWKVVAGCAVLLCIAFGVILTLQSFTNINPEQSQIVSRIAQSFSFSPQSSIVWRINFWKAALHPLPQYLLFGYGAGTFFQYAVHELNTQFDAHNDYLKLLVELGVAGLGIFIALFADIGSYGIRAIQRSNSLREKVMATTIVALLIGIVFESFFDNLYQNTTFYWMFFVFFGAVVALLQNQDATKQKEE